MTRLRGFSPYLAGPALLLVCIGLAIQPSSGLSAPPSGPPYYVFGTVTAGDSTTPDFAAWPHNVDFGGGHSGPIAPDGSYQTAAIYGDGASLTPVAYAAGYLEEQRSVTVAGDTRQDFTIYSSKAWVSGALFDAVSGAALSGGSVNASGCCNASVSVNNYNFGGSPGYPAVGGGLSVSRSGGSSGPGNRLYKFTASQGSYLSEAQSLTLTSGQNLTGLNFSLYPAQGNITGTVYDASTGQPITSGVTVWAAEASKSARILGGGAYTFASTTQPPDWGLGVDRSGENGPGSKVYRLRVTVSGYTEYVSPGITVQSGQSSHHDIYLSPADDNAGLGPCKDCNAQGGHPINLTNGNVWIQQRDYVLPGLAGGLEIVRTWNSLWANTTPIETSGMFGNSWRMNYEERLNMPRTDLLKYWRGDGSAWTFHYDSVSHAYTQVDPVDERATLQYDSGTTLYTLTFHDGTKKIFNASRYLTKILDRNANQTTIAYDASNRITQVTDAAGRSVTFTYPNGSTRQVQSVQDATGTIATYAYDTWQRLTQVTYADGSFNTFTYDSTYNVILNVKDTAGIVLEAHTYDGSPRRGLTSQRANNVEKITVNYPSSGGWIYPTGLTQVTDSLSRTTDYRYQSIGAKRFLTSVSGPGCATCGGRGNRVFAYDTKGNRTSSTDELGRATTFVYDIWGNVTSRSVQLNPNTTLTWSYTYNNFDQVLTATDPLGNVTTNVYDANGNLLSTTTPSPDGVAPGSTTSFTYDVKGQLTRITDPRGNSTDITYTSAGLIATVKDAQNNTTTYAYDARGNRTSATDALNNATTFTYNSMNRLTQITAPGNIITTFAYDNRGRRTSVTDANSKTTTYAYDDADRLTSVTDAASNVTQYTYDTENNLLTIKDALLRTTSFAYDSRGRVTTVTFPSTLTESYTYDAVGNLLSKTDRKGQTITYTYDALDRLTRKQYPDSSGVDYTYDNLGRLTRVVDATGTYDFAYDNLGRLTSTTTAYSFLQSRTFTVSYSYDAASNRVSMTDPESGVTAYAYDSLNRLTTLTPPAAFTTGSFGFTYDALSRRTQLARPNNVVTDYTYDNLSRLLSVLHKLNGNTIDGATYTVDPVGNRTAKTNHLPGSPAAAYTYDSIYQLTQVVQNGSTTSESYTYDGVGNRLSSLGGVSYSYDSSNHLTSSTGLTYTYDNNGNTTSKTDASGTTAYTWDFENRLTQVTLPDQSVVSFKYDPLGRRIQKSSAVATPIYAYDGENIIEETDAAGAVVARYSQGLGIDEPLAMLRSGGTHFYSADGLGSITSLTDGAGAVTDTYSYDSFGNLAASTGSVVNPFRYTAREWDGEIGLYFYRARYYEVAAGRFLSEDPIAFLGDINFYAYVENNPATFVDPFGLQKGPWHPPAGVHTKCLPTDDCAAIRNKMWILQRMIISHTGWDRKVPKPRGGDRHSIDIEQMWKQYAECQSLYAEKCKDCDPPVPPPVDVPAWKRFWQRNRTPILVGAAVAVTVAAIALAPTTGGGSLLVFALP